MWIEHFKCGCSQQSKTEKSLMGYCSLHGETWKDRYDTKTGITERNVYDQQRTDKKYGRGKTYEKHL